MASVFPIYSPQPVARVMSSRSDSVASGSDAPPPYSTTDLTDQFKKFDLAEMGKTSELPTAPKVLAHLELLFAVHMLRQSISGQNGLFELYDDQLAPVETTNAENREILLRKLAEKRWTVFVTKAVDRFTTWWNSWKPELGMQELRIREMSKDDGIFAKLVHIQPKKLGPTSKSRLPPLDVLMVWHAFMLNPRCYLEDCLRQGMMAMWQGMPWDAVSESIDRESGAYNPGEEAMHYFESNTGLDWDSLNGGIDKFVECPYHNEAESFPVPWTTCGDEIRANGPDKDASGEPTLPAGRGFADKGFTAACTYCGKEVNHEKLCGGKFRRDVRQFLLDPASESTSAAEALLDCIPMPGTILDLNGAAKNTVLTLKHEKRLFPNKLLIAVVKLSARTNEWDTIREVRNDIEEALANTRVVVAAAEMTWRSMSICSTQRISIRKMLSHYWDNSSPFALDLVGAVLRQGTFIEKMQDIDWLHSPALTSTVSRLITKYERFFSIMTQMEMAVPTLDVDLAWHTHQLAPQTYYHYCLKHCTKFIDHDDKIAETKLSDAFEETSKIYQKRYNEPYSECVCWYCEAVRASHTSSVSRMLRRSSIASAEEKLYDKSNPAPSDPNKGPHISAHNAIRPELQSGQSEDLRRAKHERLQSQYDKACRRAKKAGRSIAPTPKPMAAKGAGAYPYPYIGLWYAPFWAPIAYDGSLYTNNPSCASFIPGMAGNCAVGTCGGGVAAGACAGNGAGGCTGGAAAGGCGGGSGVCAGGIGGGCAGGGGGGGGGRGGGGGVEGGGGGGGCGGGGGG